jgi:hypothetical protein
MAHSKLVWVTVGLCLLAACGAPPAPPHSSAVQTEELSEDGPRIGVESIFAASDLDTLRVLVDTSTETTVRQLGGAPSRYQCRPPYALGRDYCWPGKSSRAGQAYVALAIESGFCEHASAPQVYLSGRRLVVQVDLSKEFNCHVSGSIAPAP